jgi:hypothetical protein
MLNKGRLIVGAARLEVRQATSPEPDRRGNHPNAQGARHAARRCEHDRHAAACGERRSQPERRFARQLEIDRDAQPHRDG